MTTNCLRSTRIIKIIMMRRDKDLQGLVFGVSLYKGFLLCNLRNRDYSIIVFSLDSHKIADWRWCLWAASQQWKDHIINSAQSSKTSDSSMMFFFFTKSMFVTTHSFWWRFCCLVFKHKWFFLENYLILIGFLLLLVSAKLIVFYLISTPLVCLVEKRTSHRLWWRIIT